MVVIITGILTQCRREFKSLLYTYLATLSTAITAEICQVSYNCVTRYVELFQQKATLSQIVSNNMRPRKIVWWMEAYLEALLRF